MARIETLTCDACGAEIPGEHVHLRIECSSGLRYFATASPYDERPIDAEMRELFKAPRDFCNLLCVQRWIESLGPPPLP